MPLPDEDIPTLVARARDGDGLAWEELFRRARPEVVATARQIARDVDVDDVVQETFSRALARLDTLRDAEAFVPWVRGIARRLAVDTHRHVARIAPREDLPDEPDASADPAVVAQAREAADRTVEGLRRLPDREREALLLRDAYAVGVAEIASRLDLTSGATRSLLFRARRRALGMLSGTLAVLPVGLGHRLRRWLTDPRSGSALPATATATAAVLTLASIPLIDAVLQAPARPSDGDPGSTPGTTVTTGLAWLDDPTVGPAADPSAPFGRPTPVPPDAADRDLLGTVPIDEPDGPITRRPTDDGRVGLVLQDTRGNVLLEVGGQVPEVVARSLRDLGLLGQEVIVTVDVTALEPADAEATDPRRDRGDRDASDLAPPSTDPDGPAA